jgi:uncharacterized membrane protein
MQNMSGGKTALGLDLNVGALVCYLNICLPIGLVYSIIVLVTDKSNKLPRFHALQSLLLTGVCVVIWIALMIMGFVVAMAQSSILGLLLLLIEIVILLGLLAAVVFCCIKAYQGNLFKLPIIGSLADGWSN